MQRGSSGGKVDKALNTFRRLKIMTLDDLAKLIHTSVHTVRRRLKQWQALHSYNKNGRYYTPPDVPEFNPHGLWHWQGVFFSRYGTLKRTLVEIICRAEAGLDASEIHALLGLDPRSFLSAFAAHPQLQREKTMGRFVYYSADPGVAAQQRQRRARLCASNQLPSEFVAMAIFVEKIKHPDEDFAALCRRLRKQQVQVEPNMIQNLFARHGLTVKKK